VKEKMPASQAPCCIVIATDERSERLTDTLHRGPLNSQQAAIVKRGFLRQALLRARRIASPASVLVSAREEDRSVWAGPLWFTQSANRFISDRGVPTSLSTAAAVLSVAATSPSRLVTILPSDFWVARESVLAEAIESALMALQRVPGTVATLGMSDTHPGADEDYLIVGPGGSQMGAAIQAKANRPAPSVAKRLSDEGALVASGILVGHAQAFAERIQKYWPQLARELTNTVGSDRSQDAEHRLSACVYHHISRSVLCAMRLFPPTFAMRAFRVQGSGWCSRKRIHDVRPAPAVGLRASFHGPNSVRADYPS
jgi:mannose-1-phosphate guanylyltransferase